MVDDIAKGVVMLFVRLFKPILFIVTWTYLWVPYAGIGLCSILIGSLGWPSWIAVILVPLSLLAWLWLFIQRLVRLFKKDPQFSFMALILGKANSHKEKKALDPKPDKAFLAQAPESGIPIGKKGGKWVVLPDTMEMHGLALGGSGSGKSSCFVIPAITKSRLASFIIDVKGELYEKTAHIVSKRGKVKVFNPTDPSAWGYDPFGAVREESCVMDVRMIANALIPIPPGTKEDSAFWSLEARSYLAGALLFSWENGATFTQAMRTIQSTPAEKFVAAAVKKGSEDVRVLLGHFDGQAPETLASVFATLSSKTMIFASDRDIMRCFNSDRVIRPEDLLEGTTIYFQIPEHRLDAYTHVSQLIIGQFLRHFEQEQDGVGPRVNFFFDEFARLGTLSAISTAMATLRSKGVRIFAITQSLAQIEQLYDKVGARALLDNFSVKIIYSASEAESQRTISEMIGSYDRTMRSTSSNQQMAQLGGSSGVSYSEQERKVLRPELLSHLGNWCIVFTPKGWMRVEKKAYYNTKELQE